MDRVEDYDYQLPSELIAQHPPATRTASRLLKMSAQGELEDLRFSDIVGEIEAGDLLVINNTRVIPARIFARKESGGRVEILLERILSDKEVLAQVKASRAPKPGSRLVADEDAAANIRVTERLDSFFKLEIVADCPLLEWFGRVGHMPLPPYIERPDVEADTDRYQTVFAQRDGAVAAPTAGLHFDKPLLDEIKAKGAQIAEITLHVGAGTYQPVRVSSLTEHKMHREWIEVSAAVCSQIKETKANGGRVFAIGTTVVRALESAAQGTQDSIIEPFLGDTDIFIYPGYRFRVVDRLLTNFHLPQSTLLMLVSAFSGREAIQRAYQHAIEQRYRFFSYGDAMLLVAQNSR